MAGWGLKKIRSEVQRCGYSFSLSGYVKYLAAVFLGIIAFAYIFRLKLFFMLVVMAAALCFMPGVFLMTYRNLYEEKKFEDVTAYMEQILYSFKRRAKILTALEDAKLLFQKGESPLYDAIARGIVHIQTAESGDIYREAFAEIEREYGCKRLYKIHDFLIQVEGAGGDPSAAIEILLNDRKLWIDRVCGLKKEKKNIKIKVTIGMGLSFLICAMSVWMLPEEFDITGNVVSQIVTSGTMILNLSIWYIAQKKLSGSLIHADTDMETEGADMMRRLAYLKKKSRHEEIWRYRAAAAAALTVAAVCMGLGMSSVGAAAIAAAVIFLNYPGKRYKNAQKSVAKAVERRFPEWLMSMSLQLQTDNVHVSLEKTIPQAPGILKEDLQQLLEEIGTQPNSLQPYLGFLNILCLPDVMSAMKILYSMAEFGSGDMGRQLEALVQRNAVLMDKAERMREEDLMAGIGFLVLLPMITGVLKMLADLGLVIFSILAMVNTV